MSAEFSSCLLSSALSFPQSQTGRNQTHVALRLMQFNTFSRVWKWIIRLAHVLWGIVNKHIIQWVLYPQWIYIFPALSFEVLLICKRKHRAVIINPLEYKGPANRFNGMSLCAPNCCGGADWKWRGNVPGGTVSSSAVTIGSTKRLWSSWFRRFFVCSHSLFM